MISDEKLLCTYALIRYYHANGKSLIDIFRPFIFLILRKKPLESIEIKNGLLDEFGLDIPQHTIDSILLRLYKRGYINIEPEKFMRSNKDFKENDFKDRDSEIASRVLSCINDKDSLSTLDGIINDLGEKYQLALKKNSLRNILRNLVALGYLISEPRKYKLSSKGENRSLEYEKYEKDINLESKYNLLFEDIKFYLNERTKEKNNISQICDIFKRFVNKNIGPSLDFFNPKEEIAISKTQSLTQFEKKLSHEHEKCLCEYINYIKGLDKDNPRYIYYSYMRNILLGSIIYVATREEESQTKIKEEFNNCEIFLDTNLLFYLLNIHYPEFTLPTKELSDILKKWEFKIKVFDFTIDEASRVLNRCVVDLGRYSPNIRVNAICSFLRSEGRNVEYVEKIVADLDDIVASLGVDIVKTGKKIKNFEKEKSEIYKLLRKDRQYRRENAVIHDAMAIEAIENIREGYKKKLETSIAIFLTADQKLAEFNFKKMHENIGETHKDRGTLPEVLVDRLLTNILWLKDPSLDITLESLICTCARDVYVNRFVWDAFTDIVDDMKKNDRITSSDITTYILRDEIEIALSIYDEDETDFIDENVVLQVFREEKAKYIISSAKTQLKILSILLISFYLFVRDYTSFGILTALISTFAALGFVPFPSIWGRIEIIILAIMEKIDYPSP